MSCRHRPPATSELIAGEGDASTPPPDPLRPTGEQESLSAGRLVTLEVRGRHSGRPISFPVVIADHQGERYVVAMLGRGANWVRNVEAARGAAVIRHGRREVVELEPVEPGARAPILRRYLELAPGARSHTRRSARGLSEFEEIAADYPVFRITKLR